MTSVSLAKHPVTKAQTPFGWHVGKTALSKKAVLSTLMYKSRPETAKDSQVRKATGCGRQKHTTRSQSKETVYFISPKSCQDLFSGP